MAGACAPHGQRRKALLVGAALGTAPDLDVFIDYGDAVRNFTYHRGFTHSLFVLAGFGTLLWLLLRKTWQAVRDAPGRWYAAIALALLTHPLLDAHTAYGTQILWPLDLPPAMWATVFIIDPLFTLPLLVAGLYAAVSSRGARGRHALLVALAVSSGYLGWSWLAQSIVKHEARTALAETAHAGAPMFVTPTPFNTLLWRIVVRTPGGYLEAMDSLVADNGPARFVAHGSNDRELDAAMTVPAVRRLRWFARDFVKADVRDGRLVISDLRMGQEPFYVFTHVVAEYNDGQWSVVAPEALRLSVSERQLRDTWDRIWLGNTPR